MATDTFHATPFLNHRTLLMNAPDSLLNYLFAGIPIFRALRFIIIINATKLREIIAPTRNVALNAIAFGTEDVTPSGVWTSEVNNAMNIPAIIGPIAPPIIRIVEYVADTTPVDSGGVNQIMTLADKVTKAPAIANKMSMLAT